MFQGTYQKNTLERRGAFRVKKSKASRRQHRKDRSAERKRQVERRLNSPRTLSARPVLSARGVSYELSERASGTNFGGIAAFQQLAEKIQLPEEINRHLSLLKRNVPYHESDHVLAIAYNALCGGGTLEHLEQLRTDESFLDAIGAKRLPDPTTAGDFCRRFDQQDVEALLDALNVVRQRVWKQQPDGFFDEARIDADGTILGTTGECKEGMDLSYKKIWGYHPLLVSLANTQEPLFIVNRSGNRPSNEGAAERFDQAIKLCRDAGFRKITIRGDTAFCLTRYFDRWAEAGVRFVLGSAVHQNLNEIASGIAEDDWRVLDRPPKYEVRTNERARPNNVKDAIVEERGYKNIRLQSEHVAEVPYSPARARGTYRLVIVRKNLTIERGVAEIVDDIRYFMYLTNDWKLPLEQVVFEANHRCDQENLIEQLKNGAKALHAPVNTLVSNWAYMVMSSLAWSLKAWYALLLPENGKWKERRRSEKREVLRMEFRKFMDAFVRVPVQLVRGARRLTLRLLGWNRYQLIFLRALDFIEAPLRC